MFMACSFMVHASLHWTDRGLDDILLWPFAVKHALWIYNRVPNCQSGLTPLELLLVGNVGNMSGTFHADTLMLVDFPDIPFFADILSCQFGRSRAF
jgi:hypothetical protein